MNNGNVRGGGFQFSFGMFPFPFFTVFYLFEQFGNGGLFNNFQNQNQNIPRTDEEQQQINRQERLMNFFKIIMLLLFIYQYYRAFSVLY